MGDGEGEDGRASAGIVDDGSERGMVDGLVGWWVGK